MKRLEGPLFILACIAGFSAMGWIGALVVFAIVAAGWGTPLIYLLVVFGVILALGGFGQWPGPRDGRGPGGI